MKSRRKQGQITGLGRSLHEAPRPSVSSQDCTKLSQTWAIVSSFYRSGEEIPEPPLVTHPAIYQFLQPGNSFLFVASNVHVVLLQGEAPGPDHSHGVFTPLMGWSPLLTSPLKLQGLRPPSTTVYRRPKMEQGRG